MDRRNAVKVLSLFFSALYSGCSSRRVYYPGNTPSAKYPGSNSIETRIMSRGQYSSSQMARYFLSNNSLAKAESVDYLAGVYIAEASLEGVNHDIAFAQMCHETRFLKYGNQVSHRQHNYCGLGATDDGRKGITFPDVRTGVRAHIQHLKAYGSTYPLKMRVVDPRFKYVKRGCAPTIDHLAGTWATDSLYGNRLRKHLIAMGGRWS